MTRGENMTVHIGMLGFEHMHAYSYAAALRTLPDVEITAAWDDDKKRLEEACRNFKIKKKSTDLDKILSMPLDAVIICARNVAHVNSAIAAARAGKHILCEKPLATTMEDANLMIDACKQAGVTLMTAFPCRYIPQISRARQLYRDGVLGKLFAVRTTNHGSMPGGWFIQPELSGGGAVIDHTVHVIDLLRWITGLEVTQVFAEMDTRLHDIPCEDVGMLMFMLGDSVFGTLDTSWSRPASYSIWGDVTLKFVGSDGLLEVDGFPQALHIFDNHGQRQHNTMSGGDNADLEMIKEFVSCVREGHQPPITGEDGMKALEVALGAYRSARECRTIPLPL